MNFLYRSAAYREAVQSLGPATSREFLLQIRGRGFELPTRFAVPWAPVYFAGILLRGYISRELPSSRLTTELQPIVATRLPAGILFDNGDFSSVVRALAGGGVLTSEGKGRATRYSPARGSVIDYAWGLCVLALAAKPPVPGINPESQLAPIAERARWYASQP